MNNQNTKTSKFLKKVPLKNIHSHSSTNIYPPTPSAYSQSHLDQNISIDKSQLPYFQVIGLFRKQIFIIINTNSKLIGFVDQHAIHERIRYQYFINCLLDNQKYHKFLVKYIQKSQKPLTSVLSQTINHLLFITKILPEFHNEFPLKKWGFTLFVHSQAVYLRSYQRILDKKLEVNTLKAISLEIVHNLCIDSKRIPETLDRIIAECSCKSAIKFNDQISVEWCQQVMHNISLCDFPWYCVHGRPTIHFKRIPECFLGHQQPEIYILQKIYTL